VDLRDKSVEMRGYAEVKKREVWKQRGMDAKKYGNTEV
jgi:hypothetical protein